MDQIKTGKLIAKLRKEKGMTQQQLADIFGINYRSVSKWERGETMPDIANIDLLSEIFNVTSDELFKGELNPKEETSSIDKKTIFTKKFLFILIPIIITIIAIIVFFIYKGGESKTYYLGSAHEKDYFVEGSMIVNNRDLTILINKIIFTDREFIKTNIKGYKYQLIYNSDILYSYGYKNNNVSKDLNYPISIREFSDIFTINFNDQIIISKTNIANNQLILKMIYLDEFDNEIAKDIVMNIVPKNDKEGNST